MFGCLPHVPDFVSEFCELRLVCGIEAVLRLGFDEDANLESPAAEHDACPYVRVLVHHGLYNGAVGQLCMSEILSSPDT